MNRHNDLGRWLVSLLSSFILLTVFQIDASAQTCTVSMPTIAFGNVDVLPGTAVDTTSTMTVVCTGLIIQTRLCISIGVGSAGDSTSRELNGPGGNLLRYDLYSDSGRSQLWGSWQTGYHTAGVQLDVAANSTTPVTVYARLLGSQQTAAAGSYVSTFVANPFIQYGSALLAPPCPTGGKNTSTSTSATATVLSSCNVGATTLNFGTAAVLTGNVDATSTITVQCNNSLPYTVALNGGNSGATDPTQRKMANGASQITYGLYRDSARSLPWGSTTGTNTASGTGTGSSQGLTVYGRVTAQTTPAPAIYQDTIVVTITY
jgi:spore coat protein U-like protein